MNTFCERIYITKLPKNEFKFKGVKFDQPQNKVVVSYI